MATFSPTSRLVRLDLPTLGRPTRATKIELVKWFSLSFFGSRAGGKQRSTPPAAKRTAAKAAADIRSPSRVMRDEVGVMLSLGLAEGIVRTNGKPEQAMTDVVNSTIAAGEKAAQKKQKNKNRKRKEKKI